MKKFIKKLAKKTEGFTLVELIVVIAILGILAGVAIPAYSGYLTKAKDAAVITELDAIQTAAQAANAKAGAISKIEVASNGTTVTVYGSNDLSDSFDTDFDMFYEGTTNVADITDSTIDSVVVTISAIELSGTTYANGATWLASAPAGSATTLKAGWNAGTQSA